MPTVTHNRRTVENGQTAVARLGHIARAIAVVHLLQHVKHVGRARETNHVERLLGRLLERFRFVRVEEHNERGDRLQTRLWRQMTRVHERAQRRQHCKWSAHHYNIQQPIDMYRSHSLMDAVIVTRMGLVGRALAATHSSCHRGE